MIQQYCGKKQNNEHIVDHYQGSQNKNERDHCCAGAVAGTAVAAYHIIPGMMTRQNSSIISYVCTHRRCCYLRPFYLDCYRILVCIYIIHTHRIHTENVYSQQQQAALLS